MKNSVFMLDIKLSLTLAPVCRFKRLALKCVLKELLSQKHFRKNFNILSCNYSCLKLCSLATFDCKVSKVKRLNNVVSTTSLDSKLVHTN